MKSFWSRRDFLFQAGGGVSGVALAWLLDQQGMLAADRGPSSGPCSATVNGPTPFTAKEAALCAARHQRDFTVHVRRRQPCRHLRSETGLRKYAGEPLTGKGEVVVRQGNPGPLMPSPFTFRKYGQSGIDVSEIFPQIAQHVDEMAILRSVYGSSNDHVQAHYLIATGSVRMGFPSVGSWVTYGLGTENQNLPAFVVIYDARGGPLEDRRTGTQDSCRRRTREPFFAHLKTPSSISSRPLM